MADWDMLLKMMADPALKQSRQEVEALLDAELDKSEGEMDADLVKEYVLTLMEMDGKTETPLTVTAAPVPKKNGEAGKKEREMVPRLPLWFIGSCRLRPYAFGSFGH